MASVYSMGVHACSSMAAMAALTVGSRRTVTETSAPPRIAAAQAGDGGQGVADDPGGSTRRSAGTFAQPLASDHRCAVGGGDRGDQRIQPADPGVAVPGSLFGVAVDFDDGVVDGDQYGAFDRVQQRRSFGQPGQ